MTREPPPPPRAERAGLPLLVVEVASEASAERDRTVKADLYLKAGVAEVWLVDPDAGTVTLRTAGGASTAGPGETLASGVLPGFELSPDPPPASP